MEATKAKTTSGASSEFPLGILIKKCDSFDGPDGKKIGTVVLDKSVQLIRHDKKWWKENNKKNIIFVKNDCLSGDQRSGFGVRDKLLLELIPNLKNLVSTEVCESNEPTATLGVALRFESDSKLFEPLLKLAERSSFVEGELLEQVFTEKKFSKSDIVFARRIDKGGHVRLKVSDVRSVSIRINSGLDTVLDLCIFSNSKLPEFQTSFGLVAKTQKDENPFTEEPFQKVSLMPSDIKLAAKEDLAEAVGNLHNDPKKEIGQVKYQSTKIAGWDLIELTLPFKTFHSSDETITYHNTLTAYYLKKGDKFVEVYSYPYNASSDYGAETMDFPNPIFAGKALKDEQQVLIFNSRRADEGKKIFILDPDNKWHGF